MPELQLSGCTPEPLMSYLKALGVLRLVSEQVDPDARAFWRDGVFVMETRLERNELINFFLELYRPTPIVAPWAGGSGFFGSDNREAVNTIARSNSNRLSGFSSIIHQVQQLLHDLRIKTKPSPETKEELLRRYRRELPDDFVDWMDTALVLQTAGQSFPPLLGTGGNDGRLDFTQNYMQRIVALGFARDRLVPAAEEWLRQALFAEAARDLLSVAVGQFDPGRAGGPNATTGMEGGALVNPWDFVLMLEGSLILAGAAARRLGAKQRDRAAFPFTVRSAAVGYASGTDAEEADSRGELWLPLWEMPAPLKEIRLVFAEGRADANHRQSRDGVDFAQAVAGLGTDRGITSFLRYGFLKRSGKAYVAAPLGSFPVRTRRSVDLLREVDSWRDALKRAGSGNDVPARFRSMRRRVETTIFDYCRNSRGSNDERWFQAVLASFGAAERELAVGDFPPDKRRMRRPISGLSADWIAACDDRSSEFRLSRSLAFLRGDWDKTGPIRRYIEPVKRMKARWQWGERGGHVVWSGQDLARNLGAVLIRRLMDAEKSAENLLPLDSPFPASLADVAAFLDARTDDQKLEDILWGMILIDATHSTASSKPPADHDFILPRAYALLKLTLLPGRLEWVERHGRIRLYLNRPERRDAASGSCVKPEPAILARLRAGDIPGACEIASRRLRASGFVPLASQVNVVSRRRLDWSATGISPARLLAALLFPIPDRCVDNLADLALRRPAVQPSA